MAWWRDPCPRHLPCLARTDLSSKAQPLLPIPSTSFVPIQQLSNHTIAMSDEEMNIDDGASRIFLARCLITDASNQTALTDSWRNGQKERPWFPKRRCVQLLFEVEDQVFMIYVVYDIGGNEKGLGAEQTYDRVESTAAPADTRAARCKPSLHLNVPLA